MHSFLKLFAIASFLAVSHARMECSFGSQNVVEQLFSSCPGPLDSDDLAYCCVDTHGKPECCNLLKFALTYIIIAIIVVAVLSLVCCVISCLCCPCCFCYKRRNPSPI